MTAAPVRKPRAKITAKSIRIIIDIPDSSDFDWERAHNHWKENFKNSMMGTAGRDATNGRKLGYFWCKVNPRTNKPFTMPTGSVCYDNMMPMPSDPESMVAEFDSVFNDFAQRLAVIENVARRLKITGVNTTVTDRAELLTDIEALRQDVASFRKVTS